MPMTGIVMNLPGPRVATFLSDPQRSFAATLRRMMATNHLGTEDAPLVHPVVASAARELLNKSENERSGVLSTADQADLVLQATLAHTLTREALGLDED